MRDVLVIFQATDERVEGLALAFGLGAVQRGANIRLRHLNPSAEVHLAHQSYGTLQPADLLWAQGIAVFLESDRLVDADALQAVLGTLPREDETSRLACIFGEEPESAAAVAVRGMLPPGVPRWQDDKSLRGASPESFTDLGRQFAER